jgi:hypothetical protein
LKHDLESNRHNVVIDERDFTSGDNLSEAIRVGIHKADHVVFALSRSSTGTNGHIFGHSHQNRKEKGSSRKCLTTYQYSIILVPEVGIEPT